MWYIMMIYIITFLCVCQEYIPANYSGYSFFWFFKVNERNSFPTQSDTIKLRQYKLTPTQQIPQQKKIGECAGAGLEPTTFCVEGRHPIH